MRTYVVVMILLVAGGTLFGIMHKKSVRSFFNHCHNAKKKGTQSVGGAEMVSLPSRPAIPCTAATSTW
jgi:hypothetical protein